MVSTRSQRFLAELSGAPADRRSRIDLRTEGGL